jgi:hypothetical protein
MTSTLRRTRSAAISGSRSRSFRPQRKEYVSGFPHYVADGGDENIRQWRREEVD